MRIYELEQRASYRWSDQSSDRWKGEIIVGDTSFDVLFFGTGDRFGRAWRRSDDPTVGITTGSKTGLFPTINEFLKKMTVEFLTKRRPGYLRIDGIDKKRNTFNATNYGSWTPDGYKFIIITYKDEVLGVSFVRDDHAKDLPTTTIDVEEFNRIMKGKRF